MSNHRLRYFVLALVLMTFGLATVRAADNNLVGMQWDAESSEPTLVLIFSTSPAPMPAEHFDSQALSIRFDFAGTRLMVPTALRAQTSSAASIDGVVARPLAGSKDSAQVVIELLSSADYRVVRHGNRLRVAFGGGAKGDIAPPVGAPSFDDANAALWNDLDSIVSIERQPRLIAQADDFETVDTTGGDDLMVDDAMMDDAGDDSMMMDDDLMMDDSFGGDSEFAPMDDDLFGDDAVVPMTMQDAFLPPIGNPNAKYDEIFGESAVGVGLSDDVARRRIEGLRFRDTPVQDALRSLAAYADLNILFNSEEQKVRGLITAELKNVALGDALEAILRVNGLAAVQEGDIIQIVDRSEVIEEDIELDIRVRPLNWVRAENLEDTLEDFKSSATGAEVRADRDSNVLILKDTQKSIQQLLSLVDKLDIPEKQVAIEVRLVEYNLEMAREQGINWNLLRPDQHSIQQVNGSVEPYGRATTERQWSQALRNAGGEDGGIAVGAPSFAGLDSEVGGLDVDGLGIRTGLPSGTGVGAFGWEWGTEVNILGNRFNLEVGLELLENRGILSVLANPTVTTLNNVPARIEIVRKTPYFETITNQSGLTETKVEFEETGVWVDVHANITNNDYVRMEITPRQRILGASETLNGARGFTTFTRTTTSNVIVRDDDSVVLGGLRQLDRNDSEQSVPWLGRVPVIGWLFKNSLREISKTELVLFVRPTIVRDPLLNEKEQKQWDDIDMMWVLPDYFFDDARVVPDDFFQQH